MCVVSSNVNLGGNNVTFNSSGTVSISGNITNWVKASAENSCNVILYSSGGLRSS
jgi:hypothetical protein